MHQEAILVARLKKHIDHMRAACKAMHQFFQHAGGWSTKTDCAGNFLLSWQWLIRSQIAPGILLSSDETKPATN